MRTTLSYPIAVLSITIASSAWAAEGVIQSRNIHYNKVWHSVEVGDVEDHLVGVFENTGLGFQEDGETAVLEIKGSLDVGGQTGSERGYEIRTYEDGSKIILEFAGHPSAEGGDASEGTLTCIEGTGRFEGIKCDGSYTVDSVGEMWVGEIEVKYNTPE